MKNNKIIILTNIIVIFAFLTGCNTLRNHWSSQTERELVAAGFITKLADTPEKYEKLKKLKQRKIMLFERTGTNFYVYANDLRDCIYIGDNQAFQNYQKIKIQKEIAEHEAKAAADARAAASYDHMRATQESMMDWEVWGPWYPYGW